MAKFRFSAEVTISLHTVVNAETEDAARAELESRGVIRLCHQCSDARRKNEVWVTSGELDGEPHNIELQEES